MQVDVRDIVQNPINPRLISRDGINKLKVSLLVFPKMLEKRPIVINNENTILCGNMRHKALLEIIMMSRSEMKDFVLHNTGVDYGDISEQLDYWDGWRDNPMVQVDKVQLTSAEEKELIIKDNISFGEFKIEKLESYSQEELLEYGLIDVEPDTLLEPKREGARRVSIEKLRFGEREVPVTVEDYEELNERFEKHLDEQGTSFGFITSIMREHGED